MAINKNNYEAFFLDYHEGNLTPQQVADLLLFIEQHPELREEFESFENISLEEFSSVTFEDKSSLKKEITIENKDQYLISSLENTLSPAEKDLLDTFLKQHPQYQTDLELFKKTILSVDHSIVFENKEQLKEIALTTDHLLIASVEGLLTNQETSLLNHQVAVDAEMKHSLDLYRKTKLNADLSVVYENKEELKQSERKVIPFYYYVAAAAAILLLFGIFSLFTSNPTEQPGFADKKTSPSSIESKEKKEEVLPSNNETTNNAVAVNNTTTPSKKEGKNSVANTKSIKKDSLKLPLIINEIENKNIAANSFENKEQPIAVVEQPVIAKEQTNTTTHDKTPAVAHLEQKKEEKKEEFMSLGQIAVSKFKERTMDSKTFAKEKKAGRDKKLNGWDVLSAIAKGVSKVTGKTVEVEHTSVGNDATAMK